MRFIGTTACLLCFTAATPAAAVNWPQPALNAAHTGYNTKETTLGASNIGSLTQIWSVPASGAINTPPLVVRDLAYFESSDGTVYAVRTTTGKTIWTYPA